MNLKAVEMQIALPRTGEAGRVQQDAQHRPVADQSILSAAQVKQQEHQRQRSSGIDESAHNTMVKRDSPGSGHAQEHTSPEEQDQEQEAKKERPAEHPYKGKHIDLSL